MTNTNTTNPQFPVLVLSERDPMIYVFTEIERLKKTYWDFLQNDGYKDDIFVDSAGAMFKAVNARFVKFGKFWGYNLHFRKGSRTTYIDFDWESMPKSISLIELKTKLKKMAVQDEDIWEEKFGDMHEMAKIVDKATTYEELLILFH